MDEHYDLCRPIFRNYRTFRPCLPFDALVADHLLVEFLSRADGGAGVPGEVAAVVPVLAHHTLNHHVLHGVLGVRVGSAAGAVEAGEVLVVTVVVLLLLDGLQPTRGGQTRRAAVTAEVPLGVQLDQAVTLQTVYYEVITANTPSTQLTLLPPLTPSLPHHLHKQHHHIAITS